MNYNKLITEKLEDSKNWPSDSRSKFLQELNDVADKAFEKDTVEGYLAAVLIYHQLLEELIKILIDCSHFYLQLTVSPQRLHKTFKSEGKMFGQLIEELKRTVRNDEIDKIIEKSIELNTLRIKMVHKITLKSSLQYIKTQCSVLKDIYDEIYELFDLAYNEFYYTYTEFKKDIIWMKES